MNELIAEPMHPLVDHILTERLTQTEILSSGASSKAWRVMCDDEEYILRMPHLDSKRPITYCSEHRILHALYEQGQPVPAPINVSFARQDADDTANWSITRPVAGQPLGNDKLPQGAAVQLGYLLRILHQLPCTRYGRLIEASAELQGQQITPVEGIRARWCWASLWPFDQSDLSRHPIARLAPALLDQLFQTQAELWIIASGSPRVVNHSDLYGEHIFVDKDRLAGVIDFGAAFIASPGWDFAVLAYYHGWDTVALVLESYAASLSQRQEILRQARYLGLVVALYKLAKTVKLQPAPQKISRIIQFIAETLPVAEAPLPGVLS